MTNVQNAALPILDTWKDYFLVDRNEGLGSSYERIMLNRMLSELYEIGRASCRERVYVQV
jgi:hypothetical protein